MASLIAGIPWLSWAGGLTSAIAFGFNLYMLNFNRTGDIKRHTDAANELWGVQEAYKSLLVDFDALPDDEIRTKRDKLIEKVVRIKKDYPGTDEKSFYKGTGEYREIYI